MKKTQLLLENKTESSSSSLGYSHHESPAAANQNAIHNISKGYFFHAYAFHYPATHIHSFHMTRNGYVNTSIQKGGIKRVFRVLGAYSGPHSTHPRGKREERQPNS